MGTEKLSRSSPFSLHHHTSDRSQSSSCEEHPFLLLSLSLDVEWLERRELRQWELMVDQTVRTEESEDETAAGRDWS